MSQPPLEKKNKIYIYLYIAPEVSFSFLWPQTEFSEICQNSSCIKRRLGQMLMLHWVQTNGLSTVYKQQEPPDRLQCSEQLAHKGWRMQAAGTSRTEAFLCPVASCFQTHIPNERKSTVLMLTLASQSQGVDMICGCCRDEMYVTC